VTQRLRAARAEDTRAVAKELARRAAASLLDGRLTSLVIGLSGELGAGKTTFVRGFVEGLDPARAAEVVSPTYAIVQPYATRPPVRHLDLYRLRSLAELEAIGYRELYFAPGVALVEWIEAVPAAIPRDWVEIRLAVDREDVREIRAEAHGEGLAHVAADLLAASMWEPSPSPRDRGDKPTSLE
jgi:tRNA threonylcarbamoyladenosine biosynthesis protein TsaE